MKAMELLLTIKSEKGFKLSDVDAAIAELKQLQYKINAVTAYCEENSELSDDYNQWELGYTSCCDEILNQIRWAR